MYKITVDGQHVFEVDIKGGQMLVNKEPVTVDSVQVDPHSFHLLHDDKSYRAEVVAFDELTKTCRVKVNGNIYELVIQDQFDELLHQLGMDNMASAKIAELKAPMPGMVLNVLVREGEQVIKGSSLLVLEAMKMENIIRSPADVTIRSIKVNPGDKVEKNQLLIVFE